MTIRISLRVNGNPIAVDVEPRLTVADLLRDLLELTGTHVGCEQGACGACTVLVDSASVRSCLMLAVQADGTDIRTVEGLSGKGVLNALQEAFSQRHALQCGFCTPGMLMTAMELLAEEPTASEEIIRDRLRGNLCRCTGYSGPVEAILTATERAAPDG